jgi:hypothetical protein
MPTDMLFADIPRLCLPCATSTPSLAKMLEKWRTITTACDRFLGRWARRLLEMAIALGKP